MRKISEIIIHCSATPKGRDFTARDIDQWHKKRGFECIGYHFVIRLDGTIEEGRQLGKIGAHCLGHNANSIGICYIGGVTADGKHASDTRTPAQRNTLRKLVGELMKKFPGATVHGHNEYAAKDCPSFNVKAEF